MQHDKWKTHSRGAGLNVTYSLGGREGGGGFRNPSLEVIGVQLIHYLSLYHQSRRHFLTFIAYRMEHFWGKKCATGAAPRTIFSTQDIFLPASVFPLALEFLKTYLRAAYVEGQWILSRMAFVASKFVHKHGIQDATSEFMFFMMNHFVNSCFPPIPPPLGWHFQLLVVQREA